MCCQIFGHTGLRCNTSTARPLALPKKLQSGTAPLASSVSPPPRIGFATSVESPLSSVCSPSYPPPKDKQIWTTLTGQYQERLNKKHRTNHFKLLHKRATIMYAEETAKPDGKSAEAVCNEVIDIFGVKLSARTVHRYVKNGEVGTSPRKPGNPGTIPSFVSSTLCTAMKTFVKINQINGRNVENSRKKLHNRVLKVMGCEKVVRMHHLGWING